MHPAEWLFDEGIYTLPVASFPPFFCCCVGDALLYVNSNMAADSLRMDRQVGHSSVCLLVTEFSYDGRPEHGRGHVETAVVVVVVVVSW